MIEGVLFDLDGIIADTSGFHFKAWRELVKKHFNRKLPDELEEKTKGVSRSDSLQIILEFLELDVVQDFVECLALEKNELYRRYIEQLTPEDILPGIVDLIEEIKLNDIPMALASASLNGPFILEKIGLRDAFDAIANPAEIKAGKPAPDLFLEAARKIGANPENCIGIEDSIAGVIAINKAKAISIGIGCSTELSEAAKVLPHTQELNFEILVSIFEEVKT